MSFPRVFLGIVLAAGWLSAAAPTQTRNIILITADDLRWQELFGGVDPQ